MGGERGKPGKEEEEGGIQTFSSPFRIKGEGGRGGGRKRSILSPSESSFSPVPSPPLTCASPSEVCMRRRWSRRTGDFDRRRVIGLLRDFS